MLELPEAGREAPYSGALELAEIGPAAMVEVEPGAEE
jgi:hypothetical protein